MTRLGPQGLRRAVTAAVVVAGVSGMRGSHAHELALYHHFPDQSEICFLYGDEMSTVPLKYRDVRYVDVNQVQGATLSVDVLAARLASTGSGTYCDRGGTSLISGARAIALAGGTSHTIGYERENSAGMLRALRDSPDIVGDEQVGLVFRNGAGGFASCAGSVQVWQRRGNFNWWAGPLAEGAAKQVSAGCLDFGEGPAVGLTFSCGAEGQLIEFNVSSGDLDELLCRGSSQLVSLIGQKGATGQFAPAVAVVRGSQSCGCASRCRDPCLSAGARPLAVRGPLALGLAWLLRSA